MTDHLENVLLVDDEPRLLSSLRRRLSSSFNVLTAEGGQEALQLLCQRSDVKVIVADMQMPEMNGIELLKEVKQAHPTVRRIMLTGNPDQETAVAAINEGQVMRFLRKPCDTGELSIILQQAIEEYDFATSEVPAIGEEKVHDADASRYELHRMMSCELDRQLAQIINISSTLDLPAEELENTDLQPRLSEVKRSGEDMLWLVAYMMRLSELKEARASNRIAKRFDLLTALRAELEPFRAHASAMSLTISFNSLRKNVMVEGLEAEVRLVISELFRNAIAFNDDGGHISIDVNTERDHVAVRIFSTGGCIPPHQLWKGTDAGTHDELPQNIGRDGMRLSVMMAVSSINNAQCQIQPRETGGMVSLLCLKRSASTSAQWGAIAAG